MLLPPPDIGTAYVDDQERPTKDFFNWLKSLYDYTRTLTITAGSGVPGGLSGQVQYNNAGTFAGLTNSQLTAILDNFTTSARGTVPPPVSPPTGRVLSDSGAWITPAGGGTGSPGGLTGQVQFNNAGLFDGLTNTQLTALLDLFTATLKGAVPPSGGGTSTFLRADGAWAIPAGGGGGSGALSVQTSIQGNPATNVETTLLSYTLPANTVSVVGRGVKISSAGYWGSTSHIATIRLYFGSEVLTITNNATDGSRWNAELFAILTQTGPTKEFVTGRAHANFLVSPFGSNPSVDMTAPVVIKVTGQGPNALISNEAVSYQLIVEPFA